MKTNWIPSLVCTAFILGCSGSGPSGGDGAGQGGSPSGGVPGSASGGALTNAGGATLGSGGTSVASGANAGLGGSSGGTLSSTGGGDTTSGGAASGGVSSTGGGTNASGGAASESSPGCGAATPLKSGTFTMDVDGTERKYVLDVPTDYDASHPYRLFFVWHPLGGSASQVVNGGYDGLKAKAKGTGIFVAPDGLVGMAAGVDGQGWYNQDGGDMKFLGQLLAHFRENLCVDNQRIFSSGFSFGGMMSYAVGYEYGDDFRAIAPQSGNLVATPHKETTKGPMPIMAFHGDDDTFVATSGGFSALEAYAARNHCGTETKPVEPSPCVEYQGCDVPTVWCEFPGGHAPWSSASAAIWAFFSQF